MGAPHTAVFPRGGGVLRCLHCGVAGTTPHRTAATYTHP